MTREKVVVDSELIDGIVRAVNEFSKLDKSSPELWLATLQVAAIMKVGEALERIAAALSVAPDTEKATPLESIAVALGADQWKGNQPLERIADALETLVNDKE